MLKISIYDGFFCIADKCTFSCCSGGWGVLLDDKELDVYKEEPFIREGLDIERKRMIMREDGRCFFLDDKGLCKLVSVYGPDVLSTTCTKFPRSGRNYMGVEEKLLGNACPKVLDLLAGVEPPLVFVTDEELPQEYLMKDTVLARSVLTDILQCSGLPMWVRIYLVYSMACKLEDCTENNYIDILLKYSDASYLGTQLEILSGVDIGADVVLRETQKMYEIVNENNCKQNYYDDFINPFYKKNVEGIAETIQENKKAFAEWFKAYEPLFENVCVNMAMGHTLCDKLCELKKKTVMLLLEMSIAYYTILRNWIRRGQKLERVDVYNIICYYARLFEHNERQVVDFVSKLFSKENYASGNFFAICKIMG